jgi:eukaryotic-like serine/threonine-protein kinase
MGNLVGRSLAHFRVEAELGEGGMGVVYRATDEKLRRQVALKVLPESFAKDEDRRLRFLREARSAAAVMHTNIAAVFEVGEAEGHVFIAMELVEGDTLRARMKEGLSIGESLRIAQQIAQGVARAHERGIVHRDLKPENVMLGSRGEVKILDFGLAKLREERAATESAIEEAETETNLTREGRLLGTPGYMSPEQVRGQDVDARTDVFALGVVLYEMVTGARPFVGETTQDVLIAVVRDTPERASARNPQLPAQVDGILERCLEKQRDARYADAQELLDALGAVVSRLPTSATPANAGKVPEPPTASLVTPGASELASRRRTPRPWTILLAAGLAAAGLGVVYRSAEKRHVEAPSVGSAPATGPASDAAPRAGVTRLIDQPSPVTTVAGASAAYASAMQAVHDDAWLKSLVLFTKAVELDPKMAAAHLHLSIALLVVNIPAARRAEYEQAAGLRAQLGERDQGLLEAMQPILQPAKQDTAETDRRLRALAHRYPGDEEIWLLLGLIHYMTAAGLDPAERAIALDPSDAQAWEMKGLAFFAKGKYPEALGVFERCGALSVDGADCFGWMGITKSLEGQCKEYEERSQGAVDRSPTWTFSLFAAKVNAGRSGATLEETESQLVASLPAAFVPPVVDAGIKVRLAILAGDFARATALAKEESRMMLADPGLSSSYARRYLLTEHLFEIALETGDRAAMKKLADDFAAHRDAWAAEATLGHGADLSLYFSRLALAEGEPAPEAFEEQRRAWIAQQLFAGADPAQVWDYAYASLALTEGDARAALEALERMGPPSPSPTITFDFSGRTGSPEGNLGRVDLLAGRLDDAIEHLRSAVASCDLYTSTLDLSARSSISGARSSRRGTGMARARPTGKCSPSGVTRSRTASRRARRASA